MNTVLQLPRGSEIFCAWAENCSGPGWTNRLVWVLIRDADGRFRIEGIQPEDQTPVMRALFNTSAAVSAEMLLAVRVMEQKKED